MGEFSYLLTLEDSSSRGGAGIAAVAGLGKAKAANLYRKVGRWLG